MTTTTTTARPVESVDDCARRLVGSDVCYCVSYLVSCMMKEAHDSAAFADPDDMMAIAIRLPDADDWKDQAPRGLTTFEEDGGWCWRYVTESGHDEGNGYGDTLNGAWQAGYDHAGADHPEGTECLEHWLVTDWMADALEAKGEAIVRDVAGLTIWGRCTSGQAIYCDGVVQAIAADILAA